MKPDAYEISLQQCRVHGLTPHARPPSKGRWLCKQCRCDRVGRRAKEMKRMLIEQFGGKCQVCGYNKCQGALHFHHLDRKNKSFELSKKPTISYKRLLEEAKKCVLLCANCHREVEDGITELPGSRC